MYPVQHFKVPWWKTKHRLHTKLCKPENGVRWNGDRQDKNTDFCQPLVLEDRIIGIKHARCGGDRALRPLLRGAGHTGAETPQKWNSSCKHLIFFFANLSYIPLYFFSFLEGKNTWCRQFEIPWRINHLVLELQQRPMD